MNPLLADFLFILLTLATIAGLVALAIGLDRLGTSDILRASGASDASDASDADAASAATANDATISPTPTTRPGGDS